MKRGNTIIIITFIVFLFFQFYLKDVVFLKKSPYYNKMIEAATNMEKITNKIQKEKIDRGYVIDLTLDKNNTGLIGENYTEITTTLGGLDAKRTSTNPDFAALFTKLFYQLGLEEGDLIAANLSGSFPGLNLSLISALDTMGIKGIIVSSVGSSSYGGNIKDFNYLDMEYFLYSNEFIDNKSMGFSLGGANDVGEEFSEDIKGEIISKNKNRNLEFFYNENIDSNIEERYKFYSEQGQIKAFINIGGNLISSRGSTDIDNRKILIDSNSMIRGGLIHKYLKEDKPVLHLLGLREISLYYGIEYDYGNDYTIGSSRIYYEENDFTNYLNYLIVAIFILLVLYLKRLKYRNNRETGKH